MDTTHATLCQCLSELLAPSSISFEALESWWRTHRQDDESLVACLSRNYVLKKDASRTLDLIAKGYLAGSCTAALLTEDGIERLLGMLTRTRNDTLTSQTMTQINAQVTSPVAGAEDCSSSSVLSRTAISKREPSQAGVQTTNPINSRLRGRASNSTTRHVDTAQPHDHGPPVSGRRIGKYLLTERIGQGTSGVVYRAVNELLNLSVAIKFLKLDEDRDPRDALETLQAEARLLAGLNHPNVVRLWDFEANPDQPYLVMEYVEGPSLAELIKQSGRIAPDRAVQIVLKLVDGLATMWNLGIVHRDIKPHNVLITRDGEPKLADFGLAAAIEGQAQTYSDFVGTAAYVAPEQGLLAGTRVDFRSDVYSLGVTLYHALTGQLPFQGASAREVMIKHLHEPPIPPHLRVPGLPEKYSEVILTMMARSPDDRYQTIGEIRKALGCLLTEKS